MHRRRWRNGILAPRASVTRPPHRPPSRHHPDRSRRTVAGTPGGRRRSGPRGRAGIAEAAREELCSELAARTALALDIAFVLEHERGVAHELQTSLLAVNLPRRWGIALTASYHPAIGTLEVGGDWYDAFEIDAGKIAVTVGDVV